MLRVVLGFLVLANLVFWGWSQGWWAEQGWGPPQVDEPERLSQQQLPDSIRVLNGPRQELANAPVNGIAPEEAPALVTTRCLWVNGFSPAQSNVLRNALTALGQDLPSTAWSLNENRSNGRWIVYWGKFETPELMARRKASLRALKIDYREVTLPRLAPGLALGTFSNEEAATDALRNIQAQGVRTARVAMERAEIVNWTLRLPAVTDTQADLVKGLGAAMAGKSLLPCP